MPLAGALVGALAPLPLGLGAAVGVTGEAVTHEGVPVPTVPPTEDDGNPPAPVLLAVGGTKEDDPPLPVPPAVGEMEEDGSSYLCPHTLQYTSSPDR